MSLEFTLIQDGRNHGKTHYSTSTRQAKQLYTFVNGLPAKVKAVLIYEKFGQTHRTHRLFAVVYYDSGAVRMYPYDVVYLPFEYKVSVYKGFSDKERCDRPSIESLCRTKNMQVSTNKTKLCTNPQIDLSVKCLYHMFNGKLR